MSEEYFYIIKVSSAAGDTYCYVVYSCSVSVEGAITNDFAVNLVSNSVIYSVGFNAQSLPYVVVVESELGSVSSEYAVVIYNELCYRCIAAVERNITGISVFGEEHVAFKDYASGNGVKGLLCY